MKSSIFNVFVPAKKGYAIYNTLHESLLFCDQELKDALEHNPETITPEYIPTLQQYGVITSDTEDELLLLKYNYNCNLFNTKEIQFVAVTTYSCNLGCPYCYEGKGEIYSQRMDEAMAETVSKVMQQQVIQSHSKYVTLVLFGGEPLLNLDVGLSLVETMRDWCTGKVALRTIMVTNGTLLTEKMSELKGLIGGVQLTLDGSQQYHDTTRIYKNGKGTYQEVISALECALAAGLRVSLRIQISKENWQGIDDLFTDINPFLETGNVTVNFAPLSHYSGICSSFSSHFLEKEEQEVVLPGILKRSGNVNPSPRYVPCVAYTNNIIFDGGGNVYKCITTVGENTRAGYVTEKGIVWEPEFYTFVMRDPLKIPGCNQCAYLPLCGGGCPRTAFLTKNTYESSVCGGSKKVSYETISRYVRQKYPERF